MHKTTGIRRATALVAAIAVMAGAFVATPAFAVDASVGDDSTISDVSPEITDEGGTSGEAADGGATALEDDAAGDEASGVSGSAVLEPDAAEPDAAEPDAEGDVGLESLRPGSITVNFRLVNGVLLSSGALMDATRGTVAYAPPSDVVSNADAVTVIRGNYGTDSAYLDLSLVYKVVMDMPAAPAEDYWIKLHIYSVGEGFRSDCDVTTGDPRTGGVQQDPSTFTCHAPISFGDHLTSNQVVTASIGFNTYAAASGTVRTQGSVSLADGKYLFVVPFHRPGATTVSSTTPTTFATVWREPDRPTVGQAARATFGYKIVDSGSATRYWVLGWVNKPRHGTSGADCMIVEQDPWGAGAPDWDDLRNVSTAPYACEHDGTSPDSNTLDVTFTVHPREVTVIEAADRPLQTHLIKTVCERDMNLCDLRLANAERTQGEMRTISDYTNNRSEKPTSLKFETKSSQSTTTSFGTEVTVGVEGGIGAHFKLEVKATYGWDIENTTETSQGFDYEIPAMRQGWIAGWPPMIHASGDVYVNDGDRLYLLKGVSATFADASGKWTREGMNGPLPSLGGQEPVLEDPSTLVNPVALPVRAAVPATRALAATGVETDGLLWSAAFALALLGGGAVLFVGTRRRRHVG